MVIEHYLLLPLSIYYSLLTSHYSLLTSHYSPLTTHLSLLITHYLPHGFVPAVQQ